MLGNAVGSGLTVFRGKAARTSTVKAGAVAKGGSVTEVGVAEGALATPVIGGSLCDPGRELRGFSGFNEGIFLGAGRV